MKEFTRVLTIEVTQIGKFGDEWAKDIEKDTVGEDAAKAIAENLKNTIFQADDIHVKAQLFIRDDVVDDGSEAIILHGKVYRADPKRRE